MAVNRDTLVSGETLNALLIICLELGPILEALCLARVINRRRKIETAVRHSSLKLSGHVVPWGHGQETPEAVEVQRSQGLSLLPNYSVVADRITVGLVAKNRC